MRKLSLHWIDTILLTLTIFLSIRISGDAYNPVVRLNLPNKYNEILCENCPE